MVRVQCFQIGFCRYLLPEKSSKVKQKTPVVKRSVNPVWNHSFIFDSVAWDELKDRCLELTVWDHDRLTSNDFLGGVRLSIGGGEAMGVLTPRVFLSKFHTYGAESLTVVEPM